MNELKATLSRQQARLSVERQTHLVAGFIIFVGAALTLTVHPLWMILMVLPGFGLTLSGMTGICPMTLLLRRMPWNR